MMKKLLPIGLQPKACGCPEGGALWSPSADGETSCLHQKSAKEGGIGGGKTRVFSPPIINLSYICLGDIL